MSRPVLDRLALPGLVAALVACGGTSRGGPAPAPPKRPAVVELTRLADQVCACADADCASEAYYALLEREEHLFNKADAEALTAEHERAGSCFARRTGQRPGAEVVALFATHVDTVCACAERACAEAANGAMDQALEGVEVHYTDADTRAMRDLVDRWRGCMARWPEAVNPAVASAKRMADSVCACQTLECVMEAAKVGAADLEQYKSATGTKQDAEQIIQAGQRAAECVKKLAKSEHPSGGAGGASTP